MSKKRKRGQVPASSVPPAPVAEPNENEPEDKPLTYEEERFVEYYVLKGGNATLAAKEAGYSPVSASVLGCRLLNKVHIQKAIEVERDAQRALLNIEKEDLLKKLAGMACASLDDFSEVFDDPSKKENYRQLGFKRFALSSAKKRVTRNEDGSETTFSEITLISAGERRAAINDLWEKCGFNKGPDSGDRPNPVGSVLERLRGLRRPKGD